MSTCIIESNEYDEGVDLFFIVSVGYEREFVQIGNKSSK